MLSAVMLWLGAGNLLSRGHTHTAVKFAFVTWPDVDTITITNTITNTMGRRIPLLSIGSHRPGCLGLLTAWQLAPGANSGACGISTHKNNCCFIPTSSACPCLQGMPVCSILSGPFSAQNNSKGKICPLQWGPLGWMPPPMTEWVALASYIVLCLLTGGHTFSLNRGLGRKGFKGGRMRGEEEEGEACKLKKRGGIGWFRGSTGCNLFSLWLHF